MLVYKITNKVNGKVYIGQTAKSLKLRWRQHCRKTKRACPLISRAIMRHGPENFTVEVLSICSDQRQLNDAEEYFIQYFQSLSPDGYNLATGGSHSKLTEESRQKISQKLLGRPSRGMPFSKGHIPWNKGRSWTAEERQKLSLLAPG